VSKYKYMTDEIVQFWGVARKLRLQECSSWRDCSKRRDWFQCYGSSRVRTSSLYVNSRTWQVVIGRFAEWSKFSMCWNIGLDRFICDFLKCGPWIVQSVNWQVREFDCPRVFRLPLKALENFRTFNVSENCFGSWYSCKSDNFCGVYAKVGTMEMWTSFLY